MHKLLDANSRAVIYIQLLLLMMWVRKELKFRVYFSHNMRASSLNLYSHIIEKHLSVERGIYEVSHIFVVDIMWLFVLDTQRPSSVNYFAVRNSYKCCY